MSWLLAADGIQPCANCLRVRELASETIDYFGKPEPEGSPLTPDSKVWNHKLFYGSLGAR